ncbi:hypothetical protein, partial [Pseudomonas viridiflava]|uniref:hypothetical protein n=1 Tax=Pseudomonas viridiflava TaxID=33069 RepID=UPI0019D13185
VLGEQQSPAFGACRIGFVEEGGHGFFLSMRVGLHLAATVKHDLLKGPFSSTVRAEKKRFAAD